MRRRSTRGLLLGAVLLGFAACGSGGSGGQAQASIPHAVTFSGEPTVGALFPPGAALHTCTASVVASGSRNLVLTAAHCVVGTGPGLVFIPGYHRGAAPFGRFTVQRAYGLFSWLHRQSPLADVAVLAVEPLRAGDRVVQLQDRTGANVLGRAPAPGLAVTVPAYAFGTKDDPVTCTVPVSRHQGFPTFTCTPYPDGTSGAPWLVRTGSLTSVVGVIGGLRQGGCTPQVSYSSPFGREVAALLDRAAAGGPGDRFPQPGPSGC